LFLNSLSSYKAIRMQISWLFSNGKLPVSLACGTPSRNPPQSSSSFLPPPLSSTRSTRAVISIDKDREMPSVARASSRSPQRSTQTSVPSANLDTDSPPTADSSDHQASPPSPQAPPPLKRDKGKRKVSVSEKSGNGNNLKDEAANSKKKVKVGARASIACTTCR